MVRYHEMLKFPEMLTIHRMLTSHQILTFEGIFRGPQVKMRAITVLTSSLYKKSVFTPQIKTPLLDL